jgi:hypothetical protein
LRTLLPHFISVQIHEIWHAGRIDSTIDYAIPRHLQVDSRQTVFWGGHHQRDDSPASGGVDDQVVDRPNANTGEIFHRSTEELGDEAEAVIVRDELGYSRRHQSSRHDTPGSR